MSNPTDLLTAAIARAVKDAIAAELGPIIARLDAAETPTNPSPEELLTTNEVANLTGISANTLNRWRSDEDPRGPEFIRVGKAVRYRRRDINRWAASDH